MNMVKEIETTEAQQRLRSFELMIEVAKVQPEILKVVNGAKGAVGIMRDGAEEIRKYLYG
jgi:hypothetical protein